MRKMLPSSKALAHKPKIHFTHGLLPRSVDPEQIPYGQKPFSVILRERRVHTIELLLPEELYSSIEAPTISKLKPPTWSRVKMPLRALVESPFLETYVKSGSASMLSSGRPGLDPLYSLDNGSLRLELPKELYERAGLVGSAIADGTHPHKSRRYAVVIDLRQPSMQRGKKGFERLKWSFKNVLTEPLTWLFHEKDTADAMQTDSSPLSPYQPVDHTVTPTVQTYKSIHIPSMRSWSEGAERDNDDAMDLLEWLGMLDVESERLSSDDNIDSFLSRWQVPDPETATVGNVVRVRWHGFLQGMWARELLLACMAATRTQPDAWFAITARSFNTGPSKENCDGYTILRTLLEEGKQSEDGLVLRPEFLLWELVATINV